MADPAVKLTKARREMLAELVARPGPWQNSANTPGRGPYPKGVTRAGSRFQAQMSHRGKTIYLGVFDTSEAAQAAYMSASLKLRGEFACAR